MAGQLDMFAPPVPPRDDTVAPAEPDPAWAELAGRLPGTLRLGTFGWACPGWHGIVFRHAHDRRDLERDGLSAYARHPLLSTVTLERTRHRAPGSDVLDAWRRQAPAPFRFVAFASYRTSCASFRRGSSNPDFLDPEVGRATMAPLVEGLGDRLGLVIIEMPRVHPAAYGGRRTIPDRLRRYLAALPSGPRYAVEPHDHKLLCEGYVDALVETGAVHSLAIHPSSPTATAQRRLTARAGGCVVSWSCAPRFDYESTRRYLEPFDALSRPDPVTRASLVEIVAEATRRGESAWVLVGNEAEGCAPRSLAALASALV